MEGSTSTSRYLSPDEYARQLQNLRQAVSGDAYAMQTWHTFTPYAPAAPLARKVWALRDPR